MIQFAMLISNNIVQQINLVDESICRDTDGSINEQLGIAYMEKLYGGDYKWAMSSSDGIFRGKPAMSGDIYDEAQDKFIPGPEPIIIEDNTTTIPDYEVE